MCKSVGGRGGALPLVRRAEITGRPFDIDPFQETFPHFLYPATIIPMTASMYMTVVIAFERYLAVRSPFKYHHGQVSKTAGLMGPGPVEGRNKTFLYHVYFYPIREKHRLSAVSIYLHGPTQC